MQKVGCFEQLPDWKSINLLVALCFDYRMKSHCHTYTIPVELNDMIGQHPEEHSNTVMGCGILCETKSVYFKRYTVACTLLAAKFNSVALLMLLTG